MAAVSDIPQWTEGVCGDGAAILRDGVMVPVEDVVAALNLLSEALDLCVRARNLDEATAARARAALTGTRR